MSAVDPEHVASACAARGRISMLLARAQEKGGRMPRAWAGLPRRAEHQDPRRG